jgi:hypothetical protein
MPHGREARNAGADPAITLEKAKRAASKESRRNFSLPRPGAQTYTLLFGRNWRGSVRLPIERPVSGLAESRLARAAVQIVVFRAPLGPRARAPGVSPEGEGFDSLWLLHYD